MKIKGKIIILLVSAFVTMILWQTHIVMSDKLTAVFLMCLAVLLIAGDLVFSKEKREEFKRTYQKLDKYDITRKDRPKPRSLVILSVIGIIASLLIGMPAIVTYVLCGMLVIFLFHSIMMK
jgi:hypothetical protein